MSPVRWLAALCCALAAAPAHAVLWGFVDGAGVAHFAHAPRDARYRLVLGDGAATSLRVPDKQDSAGSLLTWLDIAPEVKAVAPWLREAAAAHGIDAELLTAVIAVESGFNAQAVSPRGALGLMQMTPATADRYATADERRRPAEQRMLDVRTNVHTGARMLADLLRRLGRIDLALAAWSAGEGAVRRAGGMPPYRETRAHVHMVLELYWVLLQDRQTRRVTQLRLQ